MIPCKYPDHVRLFVLRRIISHGSEFAERFQACGGRHNTLGMHAQRLRIQISAAYGSYPSQPKLGLGNVLTILDDAKLSALQQRRESGRVFWHQGRVGVFHTALQWRQGHQQASIVQAVQETASWRGNVLI